MRKLAILAAAALFTCGAAQGQGLGETLNDVGADYARAYTRPLAEAIGTNFNSGLIQTARWSNSRMGLNISVGLKVFATFVPAGERHFDMSYQTERSVTRTTESGETFTFPMTATVTVQDAPTLFGDTEAPTATAHVQGTRTVVDSNGQEHTFNVDETQIFETVGGLVNTGVVPLAIPQASIGTLFGTDLMIRWLPQIDYPDVGSLEVLGLGVRHSIDQYLPMLPVALSVTAMWQNLSMDDAGDNQVVDASMFAANVAAGKGFGPLMVYGGLQVERSNVAVAYTYTPELDDVDVPPVDVAFEVEGSNPLRAIAGFGLNLGPLSFGADASLGNRFMVSSGLGLAF